MILRLLSYPRGVIMALVYPFFLFGISALCVLANLIFNSRRIDDGFIYVWSRISCWMFGVTVCVEGLENIPAKGGVLLFNHTSFFDIFAMGGWIPHLRFGAKIELFNVPFFGLAMRRIGILPIARNNREKAFKVYKRAEESLQNGALIALAPEGTRQISEKLGSFKAGPFVFAINAQAPVVPVVIRNASKILPKGSPFPNLGTWSRPILVKVLPAISTANLHVDDRPQLQGEVHRLMLHVLSGSR